MKTYKIELCQNFKWEGEDEWVPDENTEELEVDLSPEAIWKYLNQCYFFQHYGNISFEDLKDFILTCKKYPNEGHQLELGMADYIDQYPGWSASGYEAGETEYVLTIFPLKPIIKFIPQSPVTEGEAKIMEAMQTMKPEEILSLAAKQLKQGE